MSDYNKPTEYELSLPVWMGSGLTSEFDFRWQEDLIWMSDQIEDTWFDPSESGYEFWREAADFLIRNKVQDQVIAGHSNRGIYMTQIARVLEPHGLRVRLCMIDRTMGQCPTIGANVPNAIDLWAGFPMKRLVPNKRFIAAGNKLEQHTWYGESHLSILKNPEVRHLAIEFCRKWKRPTA